MGVVLDYEDAIAVTANDATDDPHGPFAGFFVGVAGSVKVSTLRGHAVVFQNCIAGKIYPVVITRVWSTGTVGNGANVLGLGKPPNGIR